MTEFKVPEHYDHFYTLKANDTKVYHVWLEFMDEEDNRKNWWTVASKDLYDEYVEEVLIENAMPVYLYHYDDATVLAELNKVIRTLVEAVPMRTRFPRGLQGKKQC